MEINFHIWKDSRLGSRGFQWGNTKFSSSAKVSSVYSIQFSELFHYKYILFEPINYFLEICLIRVERKLVLRMLANEKVVILMTMFVLLWDNNWGQNVFIYKSFSPSNHYYRNNFPNFPYELNLI